MTAISVHWMAKQLNPLEHLIKYHIEQSLPEQKLTVVTSGKSFSLFYRHITLDLPSGPWAILLGEQAWQHQDEMALCRQIDAACSQVLDLADRRTAKRYFLKKTPDLWLLLELPEVKTRIKSPGKRYWMAGMPSLMDAKVIWRASPHGGNPHTRGEGLGEMVPLNAGILPPLPVKG